MRLPRPGQRFVAPQGAPPKAPVAQFACVSRAQNSASWPHGEPHRSPLWCSSHASPPPRTALRGPIGSSTEGPSGAVRM
eukprot:4093137-Pyramimonas_sp.AAC.1